jgi:glycosyltransferase involved in cell wall biosynthesis
VRWRDSEPSRVRGAFTLIPNGIDDARFRVRSQEEKRAVRRAIGVPADASVVLFAGRLVAKKGIAVVAEVQRARAADGTTLLVAGDGPERALVEGVPSTRLLGSVPAAKMADIPGALGPRSVLHRYEELLVRLRNRTP